MLIIAHDRVIKSTRGRAGFRSFLLRNENAMTIKANTTIAALASGLLIVISVLWPQEVRAAPKIGVVDMKKLLVNSPDLKTSMDALKDKFEPRRQEMLKLQSEAKSHPNDDDLQREFNRQASEFQNSAYAARSAATQVVEHSIVDAIRKYAATEHFDVVGSEAPYLIDPPFGIFATTVDVTDNVLALIRNPDAPLATNPAPIPESPGVKIAVVTGMNSIRSATEKSKLRHYAIEHDFAIVLDTVYYAKPQITITDVTTDVKALLK
jgi:Skp family chaperone for outer membrane proteins